MALDSSRYFSNQASVGLGAATAGQFDKFDLHATAKYPLGFKVEQYDGTVYRYAHLGAATNRGVVVSQDLSETSIADTDNAVIAPASAVAVPDETQKPGAIGSHYVQLTVASVTANQFRGGKFVVTDDTGEGYTYDVLGNTATDTPATGDIRIQLAQALQVALDTSSDIALTGSMYMDVETATTGTDEAPIGVTCSTTTSALPFCWVQTKGVVGILQDGAIALGDVVALSTAGNVKVAADYNSPFIGYCVDPGDTTGHGTFKINLE